jgi:hypothetical protein
LIERILRKGLIGVALGLAGWLLLEQVALFGTEPGDWDWLKISGFATWLLVISYSLRISDKADLALRRLHHAGVITGKIPLDDLREAVHRKAKRSAVVGALALPMLLTAAFAIALRGDPLATWPLLIEVDIAASAAGLFVGRAASYGRLGNRLRRLGFSISPDPAHLDGAAGLRPVGGLYFYQATLLAIPAAFLAVWWVLFPVVNTRYLIWRDAYAGLLAVAIACEVLAFVAPMRTFHRVMLDAQRRLFDEADHLSDEIASASRALSPTSGEHESAKVDVDAAAARYRPLRRCRPGRSTPGCGTSSNSETSSCRHRLPRRSLAPPTRRNATLARESATHTVYRIERRVAYTDLLGRRIAAGPSWSESHSDDRLGLEGDQSIRLGPAFRDAPVAVSVSPWS